MTKLYYSEKGISLYLGDCRKVIKKIPDNFVDAIVTDPPYGLEFMGKEWDSFKLHSPQGAYENKKGFKQLPRFYTEGLYQFTFQWATECLRVLKPGGYLLSFGGTRTYHRMTCAIEDAGFEIRDCIMWVYGSGFPKSLDIGQDLDRRACRKQLEKELGRKPTKEEFKKAWKGFRKIVGKYKHPRSVEQGKKVDNSWGDDSLDNTLENYVTQGNDKRTLAERLNITTPVTPEAKQWQGWGTALKPAVEPIVVARKPLSEKTVAQNVLKWGTGGINIDESRIETTKKDAEKSARPNSVGKVYKSNTYGNGVCNMKGINQGRFPANLILECICDEVKNEPEVIKEGKRSGGIWKTGGKETKMISYKGGYQIHTNPECPCYMLDRQSGKRKGWVSQKHNKFNPYGGNALLKSGTQREGYYQGFNDTGGASRFFYCAKASRSERNRGLEGLKEKPAGRWNKAGQWTDNTTPSQNNHPTVKPIKLMEYLVRLVTPPKGTVLDPFLGSGTTLVAAKELGRNAIGIEISKEYCDIAIKRIKNIMNSLF